MKKNIFAVFFAAALLSACASNSPKPSEQPSTANKSISYTQLQHHSFELVTFNGKKVEGIGNGINRRPRIEFNEGMRINGVVCNNFNGKATLEKNILKARAASTMMFCSGELNTVEHTLFTALEKGAELQLQGETLTLKEGKNTFIYKLKDYVN